MTTPQTPPQEPLLTIENLTVRYPRTSVNAVDNVSLTLSRSETLGLVGESGSGKSSVARSVLGLHKSEGSIRFAGTDIAALHGGALRHVRADLQMIFQDPYGTLDPRMTIGKQIAEPLLVHHLSERKQLTPAVAELLTRVGLDPGMAKRYPHEFSGGQRQRIAIARAIGLSPRLIVCDEPTSALDVSVQAQIIELLRDLQASTGVAYLFISHNLGVVRQISHRVAVMYRGRIVETGPVGQVFDSPSHPYTKLLLRAVLEPDPASRHAPPLVLDTAAIDALETAEEDANA
ncbi:MAG TPA: ATP-binding cassette domain-containing protein [Trebonia sp.]|jgi:ABC-type microcin C transport system duplicated ATPase subunit YejF